MGLADISIRHVGRVRRRRRDASAGQRAVAVELIDPATGGAAAVDGGATGEVVYTTFAREATPMVRYRSSDHVVVTGVDCRCGRTSPRMRCIGRTDDMLIYKGMNVFPTAIRDVALSAVGDAVEPYVRIWKKRAEQVRFDDAIPVDIEAAEGLAADRYPGLARQIEAELRGRLQVRAAVSVVAPARCPAANTRRRWSTSGPTANGRAGRSEP